MQRINALGSLLNLAANDLGNELGGKLGEGAAGSLALNDVDHLSSDGPDLRRGGIRRLLDLVWSTLSESNSEKADEVVVGGLDGDIGLNETLPLANKRSQLVRGEVQAVEVGQAALALNLVDSEANFAERVVLILLEIGERNFDNATLKGVVCVLQTGCAVDEGFADTGKGNISR